MASTTLSPPPSSDPRPSHDRLSSSVINPKQMSNTPIDYSSGSPYSIYNSNSGTPSTFEILSDNGGYSEFSYGGHDEFFGVSFDEIDTQELGTNPGVFQDTMVPVSNPSSLEAPSSVLTNTVTGGPTSVPMSSVSYPPPARAHTPSLPNINVSPSMLSNHGQQRSLSIPLPTNNGSSSVTGRPGAFSYDTNGSDDCISPNARSHMAHSPRVQITHWGSGVIRDLPADSDAEDEAYGGNRAVSSSHNNEGDSFGYKLEDGDASTITASQVPSFEMQNDTHESDGEPQDRRGVHPSQRKPLVAAEVPNFKDRAKSEELEASIRAVEEWNSQVGGDTDDEDITPTEHPATLAAPFMSRRRAASTGTTYRRPALDPDFRFPDDKSRPQRPADPEEQEIDLLPVDDDTASIHENRYQEGQSYFNVKSRDITITSRDRMFMSQSRAFNDAPSFAKITDVKTQPDTANAAIAKYNEQAETYSILSRSATWGTRRRSEPSLFDRESIINGQMGHSGPAGLIKRFSFGRDRKEKKPSVFQEGFQSLSNIVRKKSDSKPKPNPKRGREPSIPTTRKESQSSLAPPRATSRPRPESPRLDTSVGPGNLRRTHSGSGSFSGTSPNRNVFGNIGNAIRRARSRSDISRRPEQEGLVGMMRAIGGPPAPIPNPAEDQIEDDLRAHEQSDMELDDDDDDELPDDGDRQDLDQSPINPNFKGFHEHVLRLNPNIAENDEFLVDRVAHQQVVRYKNLLGWRRDHSALVRSGTCPSHPHCKELGGLPTLLPPKGQAKNGNSVGTGFPLELSDEEPNPEGKLGRDSFPVGVPMPPAVSLPAEFECQLCFKVKKFQKPSDWTKHVHEDVQPFTCTYQNCRDNRSFKRKADWVRHENERHRHLEWWTCDVDDCQHKCYRKDNFLQHLVREHKLQEPKQKTKAAVKAAKGPEEQIWGIVRRCHHETSAKPQDEPCKFCGKRLPSWKKLTVHLAKHMEHLSLPVLRLVEQQQVNPDMIISPVEPPPVRQIPLTPAGMDRRQNLSSHSAHSSNSVNPVSTSYRVDGTNISPSFNQGSTFSSPLYSSSPNGVSMGPFPDFVTSHNDVLNGMHSTQSMDYPIHAPVSQHAHHAAPGFNDSNDMDFGSYAPMITSTSNGLSSQQQNQRVYTPLVHSPITAQLNSSHNFNPVNHLSNNTVSTQSNGYSLSPHHLTPNSNFLNTQQEQSQIAFQHTHRQSFTPNNYLIQNPDLQKSSFIHGTSHPSHINTNTSDSAGILDNMTGGVYDFQNLHQGLDAGLGVDFSQNHGINEMQQTQRSRVGSGASLGAGTGRYSTSPRGNGNGFTNMVRGGRGGGGDGFDNQQQW